MSEAAVYDYAGIAKRLNELEHGTVELRPVELRPLELSQLRIVELPQPSPALTEVLKVVEQLKADMKSELMKAYWREPRYQVTRATPPDYGRREGCWPGPSSWND